LGIAIRNLLIKVEKYEDITVDQTNYLQNISDLIKDSQKHLQSLDERGVFQSDDEVGYFLNK
jgi:CHASE3 domain sensor protein